MNDVHLPSQKPFEYFWGSASQLKLGDGTLRFQRVGQTDEGLNSCESHIAMTAVKGHLISMLKKSANEFRSDLGQDTLCAIMGLKYNVDDLSRRCGHGQRAAKMGQKCNSFVQHSTQVIYKRQVTCLFDFEVGYQPSTET